MLILNRLEKKCLLSAFVERIKVKKVSNMITYNRCNFILSITSSATYFISSTSSLSPLILSL